jgi:hypothetical protein
MSAIEILGKQYQCDDIKAHCFCVCTAYMLARNIDRRLSPGVLSPARADGAVSAGHVAPGRLQILSLRVGRSYITWKLRPNWVMLGFQCCGLRPNGGAAHRHRQIDS